MLIAPAALSLLLGAGYAAGQEAGRVWIEVGACLELESTLERYECYERRVEEALAEPANVAGGEGPSDASAETRRAARPPAAPAGTPRDAGGSPDRGSGESSSAAADAPRTAGAEDSDEITGTVASVRERLPNEHIVTLENGQVWHQIEPKRYFIRPGDEVRVYASRFFGDSYYRLTVEGTNGFIRVERIR